MRLSFITFISLAAAAAALVACAKEADVNNPEENIATDMPDFDYVTYIYQDSFEDGAEGWSFYDNDGDGKTWYVTDADVMHSGNYALWSRSWTESDGSLDPNNYAVSPAIHLTENNYLSFWVTTDQSISPEHYAVYLWDESEPVDPLLGVLLLEQTFSPEPTSEYLIEDDGAGYQHYAIPIPADYFDKTVYIGFRHFNCNDLNYLAIDDVGIIEPLLFPK